MTRLMTPVEYADAYRYLAEQVNNRDRAEVTALIEQRVVPLEAEVHRYRALNRWRDTPSDQEERRAVLAEVDTQHRKEKAA